MMKFCCLCLLMVTFSACDKDGAPQYVCSNDSSNATTLRQQPGKIIRLDGYSNYAIQFGYGIDAVNIYIVCDALPDSIMINDEVEFSGEITLSKYEPEHKIGGQAFFDLQLSDIHK